MRFFDNLFLHLWAAWYYIRLRNDSPEHRAEALVHAGLCPICRARFRITEEGMLIDGPKGGLAQNVYCPTCENGWNYTPGTPPGMMPVQAIGKVDPKLIAMYRNRMLWSDDDPSVA